MDQKEKPRGKSLYRKKPSRPKDGAEWKLKTLGKGTTIARHQAKRKMKEDSTERGQDRLLRKKGKNENCTVERAGQRLGKRKKG